MHVLAAQPRHWEEPLPKMLAVLLGITSHLVFGLIQLELPPHLRTKLHIFFCSHPTSWLLVYFVAKVQERQQKHLTIYQRKIFFIYLVSKTNQGQWHLLCYYGIIWWHSRY